MATVEVKNLENKTVGKLELADAVFACRVNEHVLYEAVRNHLAGLRAGTHKTKTRGEVSGSGRKPWRQKGTGRARVGSIRSPLWRHGGTVHGPQPRDYSYSIPRKVLLNALRSALSAKLGEQRLTVVDAFNLENHKTKPLRQALDRLGADGSALIVSTGENRNLLLASRNLHGVKLMATHELHPYDVLAHQRVFFSQDAVVKLQKAILPEKREAREAEEPGKPAAEPTTAEAAPPGAKPARKAAVKKPAREKKSKSAAAGKPARKPAPRKKK
ncbi:MAG TPA: 50S ribosomal protein L4 [Candidatus Acidoferrales bacterium]